jgi:type IV secretion system protein TrbE
MPLLIVAGVGTVCLGLYATAAMGTRGFRVFSLSEHKRLPTRFSDYLPWALLVAPAVVFNKNGSFLAAFRYRGPDLFSATKPELISVSARLNNALKRLPGGWAVYADARRKRALEYPDASWPDPVTGVLDAERAEFFKERSHFETEYTLSIIYLPPPDIAGRIGAWFYEGAERKDSKLITCLDMFEQERRRIEGLLSGVMPELTTLTDGELLTYLKSCVSPKPHPVRLPETPMYLDALLPDTPLIGGLSPRLGSHHVQAVTVTGFPGESWPGLLDALNRLSFEYRWVTRFIFEDKLDAAKALKSYQQKWLSLRKSLVTVLREAMFGEASAIQNTDAVNKAADSDEALQELGSDAVAYGYFTQTVLLMDTDSARLNEKKLAVERVINNLGFTTIDENGSHNGFDAFLGTIPGNCAHNVRHPLVNTLNLVHLFPLSAVWAGAVGDANLNGAALMHVVTEGSTPFRLSLNCGDVGHTLIVGPTGAGKSTLLRALESAWRRYPNAQVYTFDKNKSSLVLTKAVGGDFYDLGSPDCPLSFQPLAGIDEPTEAAWALEWLTTLAEHEGVNVGPDQKIALWQALKSLSLAPVDERSLTGLRTLVNDASLKSAILNYTHEGSYGRLLDGDRDTLSVHPWQVFEMGSLISNYPRAVLPTLTYLFHMLERRFDASRPTLMPIDEGWLFLDNPVFAPKLREWLKTLRRFKVYLIFASQSPADVAQSPLFDVIKESCFTKIFLPNGNAREPETAKFYRRFGLNDRQLEILSSATPKRDYYYTSPLGNRIFSLALGEIGLAYCAATGDEAVKQVSPWLESSPQAFNREYLRSKGLEWVIELMNAVPQHPTLSTAGSS